VLLRGDQPLWSLAVVGVSALAGAAIATNHLKYALLPAAVLAAAWSVTRSRALLLAALAVLSIADPARFKVSHLTAPEVLLLLGVAAVVVGGELIVDRIGIALALLLLCDAIGIVVATGHGVAMHQAILDGRVLLGLAAYWIARAAFRRDPRRTLELLARLACGIAALAMLQELVHSRHLFLGTWGDQQIVDPQPGGFLRIRPPGDLTYLAAFFAISYLIWGARARRRAAFGVIAILAGGIAVSLNRNWVIGLVLGIVTAALVGRSDVGATKRLLVMAAIAAVFIAGAAGTSVGNRILSLQNTQALQQGTLADRNYENRLALAAIRRHPVTGVGWSSYGAETTVDNGAGFFVPAPRTFIHNQYLGLWLRTGVGGLAAFAFALVTAFAYAARAFRRTGDWVAGGALMATVGVAVSSVVGIYVIQTASAAELGVLLALCAGLKGDEGTTNPKTPAEPSRFPWRREAGECR
jgi:O-antigen ligase